MKRYRVFPGEDGWSVGRGKGKAVGVHATKTLALDQAREMARGDHPSRLEVYREDGTLQDTFQFWWNKFSPGDQILVSRARQSFRASDHLGPSRFDAILLVVFVRYRRTPVPADWPDAATFVPIVERWVSRVGHPRHPQMG